MRRETRRWPRAGPRPGSARRSGGGAAAPLTPPSPRAWEASRRRPPPRPEPALASAAPLLSQVAPRPAARSGILRRRRLDEIDRRERAAIFRIADLHLLETHLAEAVVLQHHWKRLKGRQGYH